MAGQPGEEVAGLHFFNPAPVMKLVGVVPTVLPGRTAGWAHQPVPGITAITGLAFTESAAFEIALGEAPAAKEGSGAADYEVGPGDPPVRADGGGERRMVEQ